MDWFEDPGAWMGRLVFTRGIALIYLIAFVAALRQGPALIGSNGLTPVPRFLRFADWKKAPSLFHLHWSDRFLRAVCWTGTVLAVAALVAWRTGCPWPAGWCCGWCCGRSTCRS